MISLLLLTISCTVSVMHMLTSPTYLRRLARRHGLELAFVEAFSDYFSRKIRTPEGLQLIRRMNALQVCYYPYTVVECSVLLGYLRF